ncbi:ZPR1 zinc finger domain-containing protein [archaeon]|jgi:zinc finger protein|nr:ZPR1 zinc finger domain-containing protein [archaeon]MBT6761504.1 ZPR1 zinc finger domain-containing protein [archaeon]
MAEMKGQDCMMCGKKELTLHEEEIDIPHFGKTFVFGMYCVACGYRKSDLEASEKHPGMQFTIEIDSEDDMSIKVVKASTGTIKIPRIITMESGEGSESFVTNIEGLIERIKKIIQSAADAETEDKAAKKKAKNMIKKLNNVVLGREKLKIVISDKSGNSAIISDKAVKKKL